MKKAFFFFILIMLGACKGELYFGDSDLRIRDPEGVFQNGPKIPIVIETYDDMGVLIPVSDMGTKPIEKDVFLSQASRGERCTKGSRKSYVVLSDSKVSCAVHTLAIDAFEKGERIQGVVVFEKDKLSRNASYCFLDSQKGCVEVDFTVTINGNAGSWMGKIESTQSQAFQIEDCDYDTVIPPPNITLPVADLTISEVAIYQGVKIPLMKDGNWVAKRNSPIIAKRPGLIRVFVRPEEGWEPHEILAKLKIGSFEKEVRFTPASASLEMKGNSTLNFEIAAGELPSKGEFSLTLNEIEQCSERKRGKVMQVSVPDVPTELGIETLNKALEILIVPVAYNADGSGRVPNVKNGVESYQRIAMDYFPVDEVKISVRSEPLQYDGTISANGDGFGQALNFCLSQRPNDNLPYDVYFYCVFQPNDSQRGFCGGGCVAGMAPINGQGGMGIDFGGTGAGIFAHELGHAMGRPHAPCGGVGGSDGKYPYKDGSIGSTGYSISSGRIIAPSSSKDFMSYCDPEWISDYNYSQIFLNLKGVLGTQKFQISTPPKKWRSAIRERDGSLVWDIDREMTTLPSGEEVSATLYDVDGKAMRTSKVYITKLGDLSSAILIIEDIAFSGARIEIPGYGFLSF